MKIILISLLMCAAPAFFVVERIASHRNNRQPEIEYSAKAEAHSVPDGGNTGILMISGLMVMAALNARARRRRA